MFDYATSEYAVIGCVLIDGRCLSVVRETLPSAAFFASDKCSRAYESICVLADRQKPIDPVTVGHEAGLDNTFLAECMDIAPSCNGAGEYAKSVLEGYKRRQLREIGDKLQEDAFAHDTNTDQILTEVRSALDGLAAKDIGSLVKSPAESLQDFLVFRYEVNEGKRQSIKVGFPSLDGILGGFAQGGLYISSGGKVRTEPSRRFLRLRPYHGEDLQHWRQACTFVFWNQITFYWESCPHYTGI